MNTVTRRTKRRAFTLVEIMVVIAIIALLVAALLPAFSHVRSAAKYTQAEATFGALTQGLRAFQGEEALGGALPPSRSDNTVDRQTIANPKKKSGQNGGGETVVVTGAHLLAQALVGADGLNTPGFKDTGSGSAGRDGRWWNDTHDEVGGLYALDESTLQVSHPRYGSYVDEKLRERMKSLTDLDELGLIVNFSAVQSESGPVAVDELMFVDPWDMPILYYKANKGSLRMVCEAANLPGIYCQEDNGIITGTSGTDKSYPGIDFGAGALDNGMYHALARVESANIDPNVEPIQTEARFANTFTRFIHDPSQKARNKPVQADSYLLISAGPDAQYGTEDDVTNWTRNTD